MPKIFRKKGGQSPGTPGGDDDDEHDDMTITSGWSQGASSVSDRIMGRMKMNLSFGNGGGSTRNINSSSSVGSSVGSSGRRRFGGRRMSAHTVDGGGGSIQRSKSARRFRGSDNTTSTVGVEAMDEMDSNEAMTLKGQTMGRRRTNISSDFPRHSQRRLRNIGQPKTDVDGDDEPAEYSLAELRAMKEEELLQAMRQAGVPSEDISKTLDEAAQIDSSVNSKGEDQQKNLLVAMFVNSGHVKLVHKQDPIAALDLDRLSRSFVDDDRRSTLTSLAEEERRTSSSSFTSCKDKNEENNAFKEEIKRSHNDASFISCTDNNEENNAFNDEIKRSYNDNSGEHIAFSEEIVKEYDSVKDDFLCSEVSFDISVKSSKSQDTSRKSKLDKIAELKTRNTIIKRENKSLKKTVKKLLVQLTNANKEKDERTKNTVNEGGEEDPQEETLDDLPKSSLHSIDETDDTTGDSKRPPVAEDNDIASPHQPPYDVVVHNDEYGSIKSGNEAKLDSSVRQASKSIAYLKRKLKNEKVAHKNTEFRMKAELDILTYEVEGLQRELGNTLESLDSTKKRTRESRESVSKLKNELRSTTKKVKELTTEAEARDKLIETFTKILLQRVGVEGGDGQSVAEEKVGDEVLMDQVEKSLSALELPIQND